MQMLLQPGIIIIIIIIANIARRQCATSRTVSGSILTMCPGVDSASKSEYQGFLLG